MSKSTHVLLSNVLLSKIEEDDGEDHEEGDDAEDDLQPLLELTTEGDGTEAALPEQGGVVLMVMTVMMGHWMLFQDGVEQGGQGDEDAGGGEPEGCRLADAGVAGLHLIGFDIEDVVLLKVIVGGVDDVGIVEVEGVDVFLAVLVLTDELHLVADTIDGEVAGLCQGLEDVDLLIADGEHAGSVDLAKDGDLVVGHADGDNGVLLGIQEALDLVVDEFLAGRLRQAADLQGADDRELDTAVVVDKIGLEGLAASAQPGLAIDTAHLAGYRQVKRCRRLRIDSIDGDGQDVLRHDAGIVEVCGTGVIDIVAVLDVSDVLCAAAGCEQQQ